MLSNNRDGKRLYNYARENKEIDIDKREIQIYDFEILDFKSSNDSGL